MEKKYILIIFDTNKVVTKEIIDNAHGLKYRFCDITTLEELLNNKEMLSNYKGVIDCTSNNKFYERQKAMKNGAEFTENNIRYIKTGTNKILCTGPNISRLTATQFNQSQQIMENFKKDFDEYISIINFVIKKIPETRNILSFDKAMNEDGIYLNLELKSNINKKQYKLVKRIPDQKENNTEYVLYDNIFILEELKKVIDFIK